MLRSHFYSNAIIMPFSISPPSYPEAKSWLEAQNFEEVSSFSRNSKSLFIQSGTLDIIIKYWVRCKIAEEVSVDEETQKALTSLADQWFLDLKRQNKVDDMSKDDRLEKIRINYLSMLWARGHWSSKVESAYLDLKPSLDKIQCKLLRVANKNLAIEVYHQIKNKEISFVDASLRYGIGSERKNSGYLPLQPISGLPYGLEALVSRMGEGDLSMPMRLGQNFAIVELEKKELCSLNTATENLILQTILESWIQEVFTQVVLRV